MAKSYFLSPLLLLLTVSCLANAIGIIERGVSSDDEKTIVKLHNDVRKQIEQGQIKGQPKGKGLKTIKYDSKLAQEAQKIADQGKFEHQDVQDDRWSVGQNLFMSMNSQLKKNSDWEQAVKSWKDEHKDYRYGAQPGPNTGHYTQLVWADTEYVGCGYVMLQDNTKRMKYEKLYVCNYGPAGNVVGQLPYERA